MEMGKLLEIESSCIIRMGFILIEDKFPKTVYGASGMGKIIPIVNL